MKDILDQMEEHIAAIRNLQRNFDYHSKRLEKLMVALNNRHHEIHQQITLKNLKKIITNDSLDS